MASSLNLLPPSPYSTPIFFEPLISLEALLRGFEIGIRFLHFLSSALSSCCSRQQDIYCFRNSFIFVSRLFSTSSPHFSFLTISSALEKASKASFFMPFFI